jgi:adenosylcobyric acid synthase
MVLGTSSHAGKSLIAAGLCRALHRNGINVAPFKAQNMSNNAAVTSDGGEIGRAQALQARACGLAPHTDMNPVLLKPTGRRTSQVVVRGRIRTTVEAADYHRLAPQLWDEVSACYDRLAAAHDVIVLEGAGSCAEPNLEWDFVNLKMARHAEADCLLVGDIERGGVFAQLLGTLDLLAPEDRALIRALVVNKFRGDPSLFDSGRGLLEARAGIPVAGILPFLDGLILDEEDSLGIPQASTSSRTVDAIEIAILKLPSISNFTDFTVLMREPDVFVRYVDAERRDPIGEPDVIVIPGSKNTLADLARLREASYDAPILEAARAGVEIVGICGGLQMMGLSLRDPRTVESGGAADGLGLLPIRTEWAPEKITRIVSGTHVGLGAAFTGYEIHCGRTESDGGAELLRSNEGNTLGYGTERVWGTYVHGIFDDTSLRHAWLRRLRARKGLTPEILRTPYSVERELDRVADAICQCLNLPEEWSVKLCAREMANG